MSKMIFKALLYMNPRTFKYLIFFSKFKVIIPLRFSANTAPKTVGDIREGNPKYNWNNKSKNNKFGLAQPVKCPFNPMRQSTRSYAEILPFEILPHS